MASTSVTTKTVVIADDTAFVRDRFRTAVETAGHKAIVVKSAAELLARVRADLEQIDLIVVDLRLPHAPGVDLVRSIRKLDDGRLPMLIFSGTIASADEVRELAALGVAGYVNEYSAVQHILPSLAPHLFPDNFNRRSSPRVVLGIPIQYRFGNTIAAALTLNLSHGGIAIRTTSPLDSGAKIKVRFRMPGSKKDIDAEGHVAWSDRRVGMGIQFETVDPAQPDDHRPLRRRAFLQQQESVTFRHGALARGDAVAARRRAGARPRQRLLRRRGILDRHGAQDARRSADRRRAPRRPGGAARGVESRSVHRGDAARHHDGEHRPRLDRRAGAGRRCSSRR